MMALKQISAMFAAFLSIALLSVAPVWAQEMKESMKPMEGMEPVKGMNPMVGMGGMTMPANAPTVPPVTGYSEGQEILFIHTEASDPKIAKILTDMMGGSPTGDRKWSSGESRFIGFRENYPRNNGHS